MRISWNSEKCNLSNFIYWILENQSLYLESFTHILFQLSFYLIPRFLLSVYKKNAKKIERPEVTYFQNRIFLKIEVLALFLIIWIQLSTEYFQIKFAQFIILKIIQVKVKKFSYSSTSITLEMCSLKIEKAYAQFREEVC